MKPINVRIQEHYDRAVKLIALKKTYEERIKRLDSKIDYHTKARTHLLDKIATSKENAIGDALVSSGAITQEQKEKVDTLPDGV